MTILYDFLIFIHYIDAKKQQNVALASESE